MHARLGPAGEDRVRVAALDQFGRLTDGVRPGRARGDHGVVRPGDPERDRELAARGIDQDVWEEVRRDPFRTALPADLLLLEDPVDTADRCPEDDPHPHRVEAVQPSVADRLLCSPERQQDVPLELAHLLR